MKYQNPVVRNHLASQYAIGLLTPRVKSRVEKLIRQDDEFKDQVQSWQETLSPLSAAATPVEAPPELKSRVMSAITEEEQVVSKETSYWSQLIESIRFWQGMAVASLAAVFVLSMLYFGEPTAAPAQLSYIAVMQSSDTSGEPPLVITAYGKTETSPSRLELRWNDRTDTTEIDGTTLWAVERETGDVQRIASLTIDSKRMDLTKDQWSLVKNSLELVVTNGESFDSETILKGICVQLTDWTKA